MLEGDMPIDQIEAPLYARLIETMPGIAASIGFGVHRGSNTLLRGGYMDDLGNKTSRFSARRAKSHRIIQNGNLSGSASTQFLRGASRNTAGKTPMFKSGRVNTVTLRPRAFGRLHSMSSFADPSNNAYSPFQMSSMLNKGKTGQRLLSSMGIDDLKPGETAFGPGLLSGITAGRKVDILERKALNGNSRAAAKLAKADEAISALGKMNKRTHLGFASRLGGVPAQAGAAGQVGVRGNLYASGLAGAGTTYLAGYARGSLGFGGVSGLTGRALDGAGKAEDAFGKAFAKAFGDDGLEIGGKLYKGADQAVDLLRSTGGGKLFGQLGASATKKLAVSGAGKMLAMRAGAMAIPGLNVIAAASLAYDIGKMGGEIIKSGINLAKDANRSLQGAIAKPTFGMGYKDTEAAATSRSRGVQAIQNSRLNARSALGAEGAMMAAHYG